MEARLEWVFVGPGSISYGSWSGVWNEWIIIKVLCVEEKVNIVDNSNLDEYCLGRGKLHLNYKGNAALAQNFISLLNQ